MLCALSTAPAIRSYHRAGRFARHHRRGIPRGADGKRLRGYRQADTRLHLAIADAAGSPQLTASVVEARVRLVDLLNAIPMLERNLEHANVQHAGIVRAILAGDPERARRAMAEHVAGTAALLRGFLGETV